MSAKMSRTFTTTSTTSNLTKGYKGALQPSFFFAKTPKK